jgi:hypothetical protein
MPPKINFNLYNLDGDMIAFLEKAGPLPMFSETGIPQNLGDLGWDDNAESLVLKGVNNTDIELGEKLVFHVQNNTGSTIVKGTPVAYNGTTGNSGKELIKVWNGSTDAARLFMGLTASDIPNGSTGYVVAFGKLRGVTTSAFPQGSILYANPAGTGLTTTIPTQGKYVVVASVISSANNGTLSVRPSVEEITSWNDVINKPASFPNADVTAATSSNTANTIVRRDGTGGVTVGTLNSSSVFTSSVVVSGGVNSTVLNVSGQSTYGTTATFVYNGTSAALHRTALGLTGVATAAPAPGIIDFLTAPTSQNLANALTDEVGTSGGFVRANGASLSNVTVGGVTSEVVHNLGNSGAAFTVNLNNGTFQRVNLTANCTVTMPTATAGRSFLIQVFTGSGGFNCVFTGVKWGGGQEPAVTPLANRMDIFSFIADGTNWYGSNTPNFIL